MCALTVDAQAKKTARPTVEGEIEDLMVLCFELCFLGDSPASITSSCRSVVFVWYLEISSREF